MSFSRYLFSLIKVCKEVVRIYNLLAVKDGKTLKLNVLAQNTMVLNSCAVYSVANSLASQFQAEILAPKQVYASITIQSDCTKLIGWMEGGNLEISFVP